MWLHFKMILCLNVCWFVMCLVVDEAVIDEDRIASLAFDYLERFEKSYCDPKVGAFLIDVCE